MAEIFSACSKRTSLLFSRMRKAGVSKRRRSKLRSYSRLAVLKFCQKVRGRSAATKI